MRAKILSFLIVGVLRGALLFAHRLSGVDGRSGLGEVTIEGIALKHFIKAAA